MPSPTAAKVNYYRLKPVAWGATETRLKLPTLGLTYTEIVFFRKGCLALSFNILFDYLVGHIARTRSKIATCPQMPSPKLSAQLAKFLKHLTATTPFDALHQLTHRHLRWHRYQQVHVIWSNVSTQDVHIQCCTGLTNQFAQPTRYLATHHWFPILGDPHQMVLQVVD